MEKLIKGVNYWPGCGTSIDELCNMTEEIFAEWNKLTPQQKEQRRKEANEYLDSLLKEKN